MSSDALEAQDKATKAMTDMISEIDRTHLRKIQKKMHECAIKCCSNDGASLESTHNCIDKCSNEIKVAQEYVQREVGGFQERLHRCVLSCEDSAKDKMDPNPSESEMDRVKGEFEKCAVKCVDTSILSIPLFLDKVRKTLDSKGSKS